MAVDSLDICSLLGRTPKRRNRLGKKALPLFLPFAVLLAVLERPSLADQTCAPVILLGERHPHTPYEATDAETAANTAAYRTIEEGLKPFLDLVAEGKALLGMEAFGTEGEPEAARLKYMRDTAYRSLPNGSTFGVDDRVYYSLSQYIDAQIRVRALERQSTLLLLGLPEKARRFGGDMPPPVRVTVAQTLEAYYLSVDFGRALLPEQSGASVIPRVSNLPEFRAEVVGADAVVLFQKILPDLERRSKALAAAVMEGEVILKNPAYRPAILHLLLDNGVTQADSFASFVIPARNEVMAARIAEKACAFPGQTVVAITGGYHMCGIQKILDTLPGVRIPVEIHDLRPDSEKIAQPLPSC